MSTACKQCGMTVEWKNDGKQWQCFNLDGSVHWDACSKRRWEQVKATGERFETKTESGYARSVHGTKFDRIVAKRDGKTRVRGPFYGDPPCEMCVPPWEDCPKCQHAFAKHALLSQTPSTANPIGMPVRAAT